MVYGQQLRGLDINRVEIEFPQAVFVYPRPWKEAVKAVFEGRGRWEAEAAENQKDLSQCRQQQVEPEENMACTY